MIIFQGKLKAEKNRLRVEEEFQKNIHAIRQEEAIKKREEKRRQEKEKMMNEENVDKQIRMEKKIKKKDAKKSQPKMKSMSIHLWVGSLSRGGISTKYFFRLFKTYFLGVKGLTVAWRRFINFELCYMTISSAISNKLFRED